MFLFPSWKKKLLKLEDFQSMSFSHFSSRGRLFVVFISFSPLRISYDLQMVQKNKRIWKKVCSANYKKKTCIWVISPWNFNLKSFFGDILAVNQSYCLIKLNCNKKISKLQTVTTLSPTWLFLSSKVSLVIGIFLWKSLKKWSL